MGIQDNSKKKVSISEMAHIGVLSEEERRTLEETEASAGSVSDDESGEGLNGRGAEAYMPAGMHEQETAKIKRMEHGEPSFTVTASPDEQTMYEFLFYHSYMNVMGIMSVVLGLGAIVMVIVGLIMHFTTIQIVLFGVIALMFLTNSPITLKRRARKQVEMLADPKNKITYIFSDEGFDMSRGDSEYADFKWERLCKVKEGRHGFFMYLERNRAFVIPADSLEDVESFKALLKRRVTGKLLLEDKA